MKNFVAIGTSHVHENFANSNSLNKEDNFCINEYSNQRINKFDYYIDCAKEKTWSNVLSDKLGYQNYFNKGLGGYGINTYSLRVIEIVKNINPDMLLLEIPCYGRFEVALDTTLYKHKDAFTNNYWHLDNKKQLEKYLYSYGPGDTGLDPMNFEKFKNLDIVKMKGLSSKSIKSLTSLNVYLNREYYIDFIFSQVIMISNYLEYNKINYAWFNYDFQPNININSNSKTDFEFDINLFRHYNVKCVNEIINNKTLSDYVVKNYKPNLETRFLADGMHLDSKYWRMLVNDVFIPYFESRK